jgi:hypothetical protein
MQALLQHPKRLFLLDSLGAFLTASLLLAVLRPFEPVFGMPGRVVLLLAGIALLFALYSLCCYFFVAGRWRLFLKIIWAANLLYCGLTAGLLLFFYARLTPLGVGYFLGEIVVIAGLARIERKAFTQPPLSP